MSQSENRRILIVDDEAEIRQGYKSALNPKKISPMQSSHSSASSLGEDSKLTEIEPAGFDITEAENGEQALDIFSKEAKAGRNFACAIVDVRMPGKIDGLQFIKEAWKVDPNVLIVVATAYQDRSVNEIDRMFGSEFQDQWDYLSKPFTQGEIIQKVRQMISSWNRRKREQEYLLKIQTQQETLVTQERLAAVGRLARSVGHEFGNVLQPLLTKLETSKEKAEEDSSPFAKTMVSTFDEMIEAASLGANICQDLLTFSRENHGSQKSENKTSDVSEVAEKASRLLRHEVKKKDAKLEIKLPSATVPYQEAKLVQVFINLVTNSLQAITDGGKISITAEKKEKEITITVEDNGSGIAQENLSHVFQPLFTTKGQRGNGLGLAVCKQIIEEQGGKVAVQSQVGKGTKMILTLPISDQK